MNRLAGKAAIVTGAASGNTAYLAGDEASFVTGTLVVADGGITAGMYAAPAGERGRQPSGMRVAFNQVW